MAKGISEFKYNNQNSGTIEVISGPMFSGKTEELIRRLKHHEMIGKKVICIKPAIDDRYHDSNVVSHDNNSYKAIAIDLIDKIVELTKDKDILGIDEAQFFHESIAEVISQLANEGKKIIISGLNLDYKGQPFTTMANVMALAESVVVKQGKCEACGDFSTHTYRKPMKSTARIAIGGSELYEARCRKCFSDKKQ